MQKLRLGEPEPNDWAGRIDEVRLMAVLDITRSAYAWTLGTDVDVPMERQVVRVNHRVVDPGEAS